MRGYEITPAQQNALQSMLRIPMRGYEIPGQASESLILLVTNPHAGL